jgi:sodium/proline symporter
MVTRYLAGENPEETRSAWWVYNGFVQSTWIAMTVFGIALRGVMPGIADPEEGLSLFHRTHTGPIITGIIVADIFATIAATSNSLLVAMSQTVSRDLFARRSDSRRHEGLYEAGMITALLGAITMIISLRLNSTVATLALSSVSLMGAGLATAMLVRLLDWRRTDASLIASVTAGISTAVIWKSVGLSGIINEAAPGIVMALLVNAIVASFLKSSTEYSRKYDAANP